MLFVGSSHVAWLEKFRNDRHTPKKFKNLLRHTQYLGVGGVKWWCLKNNLKGIGLPDHKQHLGNQWLNFRASNFHPHYVCLWVGSNDDDKVDTMTKYVWFSNKPEDRREKVIDMMNKWFEALTPHIDEFLIELSIRPPGSSIKYIPIFPRPWWSPYTHRFAQSQ